MLFIFIGITVKSYADDGQGKTGRLFRGFGVSFFSQYESSPMALTPNYVTTSNYYTGSPFTQQVGNNTLKFSSIAILSYRYTLRYNLVEMSKDASISISMTPSIAWTIFTATTSATNSTPTGNNINGAINIPAFLEFNYGNLSTFSTDKEIGYVVGLGYEYTIDLLPIVNIAPTVPGPPSTTGSNSEAITMNAKYAWLEPAIEIGFRFWGKQNHAHEVTLKYGFGENSTKYVDANNTTQTTKPSSAIKLT